MKQFIRMAVAAIVGAGLLYVQAVEAVEKGGNTSKVAKVNDVVIMQKDFDNAFRQVEKRITAQGKDVSDTQVHEIKQKILENIIDTELLYQAAKKEGVKPPEENFTKQWEQIQNRMKEDAQFKAGIEEMNYTESELKNQIKRQMTIQQFVVDKFVKPASVSAEEIKSYYTQNEKAFHTPEQVRASHILIKVESGAEDKKKVEAKKQIQEIQTKIKNGEDFAALAEKFSQCPSKSNGGDLGYFERGKMVKPFEDAAFQLKVGEVSDVVSTDFGYHLIKVTDKKSEGTVSLEKATPNIENFLKQQKAQQEVTAFLQKQKETSKVERYLK
jgi:peptidyl-prolyl cis-trans isomerase C